MYEPDALILTRLTRRANEDRRVVIQGFDVGYRTFLMIVLCVPPGAILGLIFFFTFGNFKVFGFEAGTYTAMIIGGLTSGVVYWIVSAKTRAGVSYFKSLADWKKERTRIGKMHLGVELVEDVKMPSVSIMQRGAVPINKQEDVENRQVFEGVL